ncbi:MAG: cobalamin-dependent protein [Thermaerobacter sp.]|nr:cobalamin-dependent protein [Thermaerobacter sp.]
MAEHKIRVLLCKTTMESHDRGVRFLATKLRDAGMEVIYLNFLEPSEVVETAIEEDVDVVGLSSSVQGHVAVLEDVTSQLQTRGRDDVLILVGGVIPEEDVEPLRAMGVSGVFGPGSYVNDIVQFIREKVSARI